MWPIILLILLAVGIGTLVCDSSGTLAYFFSARLNRLRPMTDRLVLSDFGFDPWKWRILYKNLQFSRNFIENRYLFLKLILAFVLLYWFQILPTGMWERNPGSLCTYLIIRFLGINFIYLGAFIFIFIYLFISSTLCTFLLVFRQSIIQCYLTPRNKIQIHNLSIVSILSIKLTSPLKLSWEL